MCSGMPRISLTFAVSCSAAVTQVVPSPRARSARQKLHAAWMTESNRPGRPLPSWRPMIGRDDDGRDLGEVLGEVRGRRHHLLAAGGRCRAAARRRRT